MSITPVRESIITSGFGECAFYRTCTEAFTVQVGKRQLDEINRIRYELELMAVALAVETPPRKTLAEFRGIAREITAGARKRATWNKSLM